MNAANAYRIKRERLLNAIEFKPVDRLQVTGFNGTIAALENVLAYFECARAQQ